MTEFKMKIKLAAHIILNNGVNINKKPDFILFNIKRLKRKIIVINTKKFILVNKGLFMVINMSINAIMHKINTENKKLFIAKVFIKV